MNLLTHRKETGSFNGDVDEYCSTLFHNMAQGKVFQTILETADGGSIQILNRPLPHGGWVTTQEDITERKRAEERITHLAHYDALTDLPNRTLFHERLEGELARIARGEQLAVLYIDIDEFKSVNDSLGHLIGDELLKSVAVSLGSCIKATDFVARLGGDEFAIVQTAIKDRQDVSDLVTRIYRAIREPYECLGHRVTTDASIGIALAPQHGGDLDQLLKNADLAMYAAKAAGRRTYRFFEPEMDARVKARRVLEMDLRQAITDGGLEVYYQPFVNLADNKITGCEALLRWRHPERGMIPPSEFIPVAEETGLISELGKWVLTTACAEAATWPDDIKLAVNVSPIQFRTIRFALKVVAALAASGLPASRLELEITEAVLIRDDETALAILHQLRAIGVRIALDDFGTGYSSLSYLQRFPFDKIKIDRCFVSDIADPDGSSMHRPGGGQHRRGAQHHDDGGRRRDGSSSATCSARSAAPKCRAILFSPASRPPTSCSCSSRRARAAKDGGRSSRARNPGARASGLPEDDRCSHRRRCDAAIEPCPRLQSTGHRNRARCRVCHRLAASNDRETGKNRQCAAILMVFCRNRAVV